MALIEIKNLHLHVAIENAAGIMQGINSIISKLNQMAQELDTLKTEVAETNTVIDSAIILIKGIKAKLDAAIASGDPAALTSLSDSLNSKQSELAAAITENTPAENEPPV
jgi:predicted RNA-binding Zn ribbon-like protein